MIVLQGMAVLIEYPALALAPAALLLALYLIAKRRLVAVAAGLWLAYAAYEYGMKLRLLCSGECNIRIDLLLIYPLLLIMTFASFVVFALSFRKAG
jgi:hypothetical protein